MKKNLKILLADDDSDDSAFFKEVLTTIEPSAELIIVNNGRSAIEHLTRLGISHLPCAVILDYNMPLMKAPEVLDWMKARSWYDSVQRFVWSTSDSEEFRVDCLAKGAVHYFQKPTTVPGLVDILHEIMKCCEMAVR